MTIRNKNGFTLVEVIATAVIITIISVIGIPILTGYLRDAKLDSARGKMEMIGAAVMHTHTRGTYIDAKDWEKIGITNPSDGQWFFSFPVLDTNANEATVNNYSITVTGQSGAFSGQTGTYCPNKGQGSGRWTGIMASFD